MDAKKYAYAAVGAPVVVARKTQERVDAVKAKATKRVTDLSKEARKTVDLWAKEGEKTVNRVADSPTIDEFAAKVDFDQAKEQVNKLRDQLEDLLATWRTNFRPAGETKQVVEVETPKPAPAAKKPAAKTTAAKKPAAKATAAKKPAAKAS